MSVQLNHDSSWLKVSASFLGGIAGSNLGYVGFSYASIALHQLSRRYYPIKNWSSSRCSTSVLVRERLFPSWHQQLTLIQYDCPSFPFSLFTQERFSSFSSKLLYCPSFPSSLFTRSLFLFFQASGFPLFSIQSLYTQGTFLSFFQASGLPLFSFQSLKTRPLFLFLPGPVWLLLLCLSSLLVERWRGSQIRLAGLFFVLALPSCSLLCRSSFSFFLSLPPWMKIGQIMPGVSLSLYSENTFITQRLHCLT